MGSHSPLSRRGDSHSIIEPICLLNREKLYCNYQNVGAVKLEPEQLLKLHSTTLVCSSANALPSQFQTWVALPVQLDPVAVPLGIRAAPHQEAHRRESLALREVALLAARRLVAGTAR